MSSALPHKNNILNTWGQFSAWVISQFTNFSILFPFFGPTKQYFQRWKKVDMWSRCCKFTPLIRSLYAESYHMVSFWNLPPPRTFKTVRLIQHMKKVDMLSHCYRFIFRTPTKHFVRHMNQLGILSHVWNVFSFPYNKAIRWPPPSVFFSLNSNLHTFQYTSLVIYIHIVYTLYIYKYTYGCLYTQLSSQNKLQIIMCMHMRPHKYSYYVHVVSLNNP